VPGNDDRRDDAPVLNPPPAVEPSTPDPRRGPLISLVVIALLVAIGLIVAHALRSTAQLQDCVMSGRTNCVPIENSGSDPSTPH
jgi:hypothetical protein